MQDAESMQYICPLIPKSAAAVGHEQLTISSVPVLAFNGDADPTDQRVRVAQPRFVPADSSSSTGVAVTAACLKDSNPSLQIRRSGQVVQRVSLPIRW